MKKIIIFVLLLIPVYVFAQSVVNISTSPYIVFQNAQTEDSIRLEIPLNQREAPSNLVIFDNGDILVEDYFNGRVVLYNSDLEVLTIIRDYYSRDNFQTSFLFHDYYIFAGNPTSTSSSNISVLGVFNHEKMNFEYFEFDNEINWVSSVYDTIYVFHEDSISKVENVFSDEDISIVEDLQIDHINNIEIDKSQRIFSTEEGRSLIHVNSSFDVYWNSIGLTPDLEVVFDEGESGSHGLLEYIATDVEGNTYWNYQGHYRYSIPNKIIKLSPFGEVVSFYRYFPQFRNLHDRDSGRALWNICGYGHFGDAIYMWGHDRETFCIFKLIDDVSQPIYHDNIGFYTVH